MLSTPMDNDPIGMVTLYLLSSVRAASVAMGIRDTLATHSTRRGTASSLVRRPGTARMWDLRVARDLATNTPQSRNLSSTAVGSHPDVPIAPGFASTAT